MLCRAEVGASWFRGAAMQETRVAAGGALAFWAAALVAGCGVSPPSFDEKVCDGSQDLRLAARLVGGGPTYPGADLLHENGFLFLYVRGDCRAWVKESDSWAAARTLELGADRAARLFDALALPTWHAWRGTYSGNAFDAADWVLATPATRIECRSGCLEPGVPASVARIAANLAEQIFVLADAGTPLDGGVRFLAIRDEPGRIPGPLAWPLATPVLASVAHDMGEPPVPGRGIAVSDEEDARALRELVSSSETVRRLYGLLPVRDDAGAVYDLFVRDMLPFESDAGLVALPGGG